MRAAAALLLATALAHGGPADDALFRARHAQHALGDLPAAISLYKRALKDTSLTAAEQAEVHLRIALCYARIDPEDPDEQAMAHLSRSLYEQAGVPPRVRARAATLRDEILSRRPKPTRVKPPPKEDPTVTRARRLRELLGRARRYLDERNEGKAFFAIQRALELDPEHAEALALEAELETRLSGLADFVRDPLRLVKAWADAQIEAVERQAAVLIREARAFAYRRQFNLADARYREAAAAIDACEFAEESPVLVELRLRIRESRLDLHRRFKGPDAELDEPLRTPRATLVGDLLGNLQRMLDVISSREHEYRLLPVGAPARGAPPHLHTKPRRLSVLTDLPSAWSRGLFAHRYLPLRVVPDSWRERGNYLEAVGGILVARNRGVVLDAAREELARLVTPDPPRIRARFLLVSAPPDAVRALAKQFGAFRVTTEGRSLVAYRAIDPRYSLDHVASVLRDAGGDVKLGRDLVDAEFDNGTAQTFFAARRLTDAQHYENAAIDPADTLGAHYGLLVDAFPLREADGRTALLLRLTARLPLPPLPVTDTPRFLTQESDVFVDLEPGSILAVAGLADPFAAAAGADEERLLLLLWQNPRLDGVTAAPEVEERAAEISLRDLLLRARDLPGPRTDAQKGFVARDRLQVLRERGRFLVDLLQERLGTRAVELDLEQAVVRVRPDRREALATEVAELERESRRSYVVRVQARAVPTAVFERWAEREGLQLAEFGSAHLALSDAPSAEFALRNLPQGDPGDVFAPAAELPAHTTLGLLERHVLSARSHTSPAFESEEDLAQGGARTVTEGLRVSVRPYRSGARLLAAVEVETAGLESEVEELALTQAVRSYRTRVAGKLVRGRIDFGEASQPRTALVCRVPHPTASTTDNLVEIVVAISVQPSR